MRPSSSRKLGWLALLAITKAQYNTSSPTAYDHVDPLIGTINGGELVSIETRTTAKTYQAMYSLAQPSLSVRSPRCHSTHTI
jgi:hypothetical protein